MDWDQHICDAGTCEIDSGIISLFTPLSLAMQHQRSSNESGMTNVLNCSCIAYFVHIDFDGGGTSKSSYLVN